jgi:hypothetical protein
MIMPATAVIPEAIPVMVVGLGLIKRSGRRQKQGGEENRFLSGFHGSLTASPMPWELKIY